ncbi:MAG: archease [Methanothrix sp.]|jgi:SHS2 domain-containing protein|nr:archease [Methanothrix sp.]
MIAFEYLEHTADIMFRAYGSTQEEMLSHAASALFKAMVDPATIAVRESWTVEIEAPDLESLAYQWLSEIVFLFETESAVFSTFIVRLTQVGAMPDETIKLHAEIGGERIDLNRHAFGTEVKAVTRHKFGIKKNDLWCIQVVLDV